jgi:hypothetical protein
MMRNTLYIILIMLLTVSCEKFTPGDCFKNTGQITTEKRELLPFRYLSMYNNVDVYLTHGASQSVEVKAGENIIPGIITTVSENTLSIANNNSCNWVRSYDKPIEVYITTPVLDSIVYQASGNLIFTNEFVADSMKLDVLEGAGNIQMWVKMKRTRLNLHYGTVDLTVRGYSQISHLHSGGYGPADLRDLNTVYTYMTNNSTNNCFVRTSLELEVKIENVGDVYYFGNPPTVNLYGIGTGKLYKQ